MANTVGDGVVQSRLFWMAVSAWADVWSGPVWSWLQVTSVFSLNWKNSWKDTKFLTTRTLSARQMAGWKTNNNNSCTKESELWRNAGPSAFQLQENVLKSDKIWCAYLVVNCVGLRTFWMLLVYWQWWQWIMNSHQSFPRSHNFEPSCKICCFATEMSWVVEFRFFCGNSPISENSHGNKCISLAVWCQQLA